jgi:hypothetical protein
VNYKIYKVKGINPETDRSKTVTIKVPNITTPEQFISSKGEVNPPFTITEVPFTEPTEKQIEYAKDLNIGLKKEYTREDVSSLIDRAVNADRTDPNPGLIEFASNRGLMFSLCIGKKALYDLIYNHLEPLDKLAFYCFCVYRSAFEDRHPNLDTSPIKDIFYFFAEKYINDKAIMRTIESYSGSDIRFFGSFKGYEGASKNTRAYKRAYEYLNESPIRAKYQQEAKKDKPKDKSYNFGCSHLFIGIIILLIIIAMFKSC